ncbi:multidrug resistance protein MdtG [Alicyclobacillus cellulosilyticus]|uniref:Multidrug resistance protein MdtG n=1 Tax=Alicyclobacillus cellulosilyticus TaxID=1003997 RepID=A0A917NJY2_9BACL|nr:MFS transporter [Alicyclobacillus cellulosilyticus]GGJ06746.1 multidrug resistance protein MdtG [Alicyclobacillus cellulosilyticus]
MQVWQRNLWVLWVGAFVTSASYSMVIPFLPLFLLQMGVHRHVELWSGALFSASFLAGAVASPYWGSLADRYGRKPMIIRAGLVLSLIYTGTAFVHHPYELLVLRILQGLLTGFIPGAIALVGTNTPEDRVGYALAMMSTATATGGILGPLFGGVLSQLFGSRIAFATAGLMVFCATWLVVFWVKEERFVPGKARVSVFQTVGEAVRNRRLLMVLLLNVCTSFSIMTIEPVLPLYIASLGGQSAARHASLYAGIVFSLSGVASIVFAPRWGRLADRIGFRKVVIVGLIGGALGNLAQIPFHHIVAFAAVRFAYGAFFCAVFPAIQGLIVHCTEPRFRGRAFGLNQTANQIGNMLGPMIGGWVGGVWSVHAVFWLTGLLLAATVGLAVWTVDVAPRNSQAAPATVRHGG